MSNIKWSKEPKAEPVGVGIFKHPKHTNHLPRVPLFEAHGSRSNSNKLDGHAGVVFFRELERVYHDKQVTLIDFNAEVFTHPVHGEYILCTATFVNSGPDVKPIQGDDLIMRDMAQIAADISAGGKRVVRMGETPDLVDGEPRKLTVFVGVKDA